MCLMQMAYFNTAPGNDAEKKNELTETPFHLNVTSAVTSSVTETVTATTSKIDRVDERIVKTADKPIVPFSELKIKIRKRSKFFNFSLAIWAYFFRLKGRYQPHSAYR